MPRPASFFLLVVTLVCSSPGVAGAQRTAGPADDVEAIIGAMGPGDELVLDDGLYALDERFSFDIAGTEAEPIVIRAADGATPHFRRADDAQNVWDLRVEHVVIRGLEFSGGAAGLRVESARSFTLEDCHVHDTGDVAIRMNDVGQTYRDVRILHNHVHHTNGTGEGMYLGCNLDGCRLSDSLIANNYVHHTNQMGVLQGDGIEIKEGSSGNVVRDNVIHDTLFPCILTYSTVGNGPPNVVERNAMWNCGNHGIQSAADTVIRNNVLLGSAADGIAMQPHQSGDPENLTVVHNTILQPSNDAISLRRPVGPVVIANNAVFSQRGDAIFLLEPTAAVTVVGNAGQGAGPGVAPASPLDLVLGSYAGVPPMDVFPRDGGALVGGGASEHVVGDDFNGRERLGVADVGAYAWAADGNPGWPLAEGFKRFPEDPLPETDGGVPVTDVDAGATVDGGTGARAENAGGCRVGPSPRGLRAAWLALLLPLLVALRVRAPTRRRRRPAMAGGASSAVT